MAEGKLNSYIEKRYNRWLDYAKYHCSLAGMSDEAIDVLNEVLAMLLEKPKEYTVHLLESKHGKYTELDFYVLQMIKLNITSSTSPYQHKYKPMPVDSNVDWQRLKIIDEIEIENDRPGEIVSQYNLVREIVNELYLSEFARKIFEFHFFNGEPFSEWPGPEDKKNLYEIYNQVQNMIRAKLKGKFIF